jgi:hypothetical protein
LAPLLASIGSATCSPGQAAHDLIGPEWLVEASRGTSSFAILVPLSSSETPTGRAPAGSRVGESAEWLTQRVRPRPFLFAGKAASGSLPGEKKESRAADLSCPTFSTRPGQAGWGRPNRALDTNRLGTTLRSRAKSSLRRPRRVYGGCHGYAGESVAETRASGGRGSGAVVPTLIRFVSYESAVGPLDELPQGRSGLDHLRGRERTRLPPARSRLAPRHARPLRGRGCGLLLLAVARAADRDGDDAGWRDRADAAGGAVGRVKAAGTDRMSAQRQPRLPPQPPSSLGLSCPAFCQRPTARTSKRRSQRLCRHGMLAAILPPDSACAAMDSDAIYIAIRRIARA